MSTDLIKKRLKIISDLENEVRDASAVLRETLEENDTYQEIQEQEKELKQTVKEQKTQVLEKPEIKSIKENLKELREELKENRKVLSHELAEYFRQSGSLEIEDNEGNVKRLEFSVKLLSQ